VNSLNQLPLIRILLSFIAGIIAAIALDSNISIPYNFIVIFAFFICLIIVLHTRIFRRYSQRWISGFLINIFVFLCAYAITDSYNIKNRPSDFSYFRSSNDTIVATVAEPVSERENTCKLILDVESVMHNKTWIAVEGKSIAYFAKDTLSKTLKYGDRLIISGAFSDVGGPQNPGEFNYKHYLAMRSIYSQGFVKAGQWQLLEHNNGNAIISFALGIREKFLKIFEKNNISGEQYAVAGALILGYTDKIDADLISAYQGTGALHILSVSGMHVGVVFIVLNFLLAFLDRLKKGKYIKAVILVLLIWFYATLTGLSPAVNRAAAMITFVILGKASGRLPNIYNTLAASLLFLLLWYPLWIMDTGFQLSYIAVIGIVMLQRRIHYWWAPKNWLMKQLWALVSVSMAAQMATFPLSLLYFHQFPNYFLVTNLVVVPLSNMIIYCGMLVLLASPVGALSTLLSKMLVYMLTGLNASIRYIEQLPYSAIKGIHISSVELLLIYAGIILLAYFFYCKRSLYLKLAFLPAILFAASVAIRSYTANTQRKLIVYDIKKSSAIDFIAGNNHTLLSDTAMLSNAKTISQHLQNNWNALQLKEPLCINFKKPTIDSLCDEDRSILIKDNVVQFYDKKLAIINSGIYLTSPAMPVKVDYLVISGNPKIEIGELLETYTPRMIIIDSSNSLRRSLNLMNECAALNVPCYSVLKSGAFEVDL